MSDVAPLSVTDGVKPAQWHPLGALLFRYGMSTLGPISVSAAHFIAALIFLRLLPRAEFGLFSFVFIIVPFCFSMSGALFGTSLVNTVNGVGPIGAETLAAYMKANILFCALAAVAVFGFMLAGSAMPALAGIVALYGGLMTLRWFARSHAYAIHKMPRAIASDVAYSIALVTALAAAAVTHNLTALSAAAIMAACAFCALGAFGWNFLAAQARAIFAGSLRGFMPVWRDLARWSLLGVVTTEASANAHAYLVTFIAGPHAFALLAVGALFMRPVSLVLTALPDAERPAMARAMAQNKLSQAVRALSQFRVAGLSVLAATVALAAIIMIWFPQLVLKNSYDERSVLVVIAITTIVMTIRTVRTPESVFLQVVGEYRALAGASMRSSVVSIAITLTLLLVFGPVASMFGILTGEIVGAHRVFTLTRRWRAAHSV